MAENKIKVGEYEFSVEFVKPNEIQGFDGQTLANDFKIVVRNDMSEEATRLTFIHEIVHTILLTQGRHYQVEFNVEDMCEFISYQLNEINRLVAEGMKIFKEGKQ